MSQLGKKKSKEVRKYDAEDGTGTVAVVQKASSAESAQTSPQKKSFLHFEVMPGGDQAEMKRLLDDQPAKPPAARSYGHGHGGDGEKCGVYKTLANIFISFVGAGILSLPHAFAMSGLVLGGAFLIILAILAFYCILLLVDCKKILEHKGVVTYAEVAEHALGGPGRTVVEILLVLSQTGFCAAYVVFIYTTLPQLLPGVAPWAVISIVVPLQVALAMLRDLSALAPFSLLADCAHVVGMLVVLKDDIQQYNKAHELLTLNKGWPALPFLFGVVIYCYEGISMILPVEDAMADKSKFKATMSIGFGTITAIFLVFGAVGYTAFGENTMELITDNLPNDWSTHSVKLALCCALFFTFPIMMVPVYEVIERSLEGSTWFQRNVAPGRRWMVMKVLRTITVGCIAMVAVSVPGFSDFIAFIGSFCCASLAFILPATCHLVLFSGKITSFQKFMDYFMIVFGFTGMVFGVAESIRRMATEGSS